MADVAHEVVCFFFSSRRRHTRCSRDWSSDVCSSDLAQERAGRAPVRARRLPGKARAMTERSEAAEAVLLALMERQISPAEMGRLAGERSEERRVGKECRARGARYQVKTISAKIVSCY